MDEVFEALDIDQNLFLTKYLLQNFNKNGGMLGNLTPFTRSNQKQAGQLIKASILERLTS